MLDLQLPVRTQQLDVSRACLDGVIHQLGNRIGRIFVTIVPHRFYSKRRWNNIEFLCGPHYHTSSQFSKASAILQKPGKRVSTTVATSAFLFPPARGPRVARPTIWLYKTRLFVGLAIIAALICGASKPVVKTP